MIQFFVFAGKADKATIDGACKLREELTRQESLLKDDLLPYSSVYDPNFPVQTTYKNLTKQDFLVFYDPFDNCHDLAKQCAGLAGSYPDMPMFYVDSGEGYGRDLRKRFSNVRAISYDTVAKAAANIASAFSDTVATAKATTANYVPEQASMEDRLGTPAD